MSEVVCSECGGNDLATVEKRIAWQRATFVRKEDGTFEAVDWGDDVGDETSDTIGVACADCSSEWLYEDGAEPGTTDAKALTTRDAWEASHPPKPWLVTRERLLGTPQVTEGERFETDSVTVWGRTAREAIAAASENGMIEGRYPWRGRTAMEMDA